MQSEETYAVKQYLRYRITLTGVEEILLSWVGYKEKTWEPLSSLFLREGDQEYIDRIRQKYREIKRKYDAKGIKVEQLEIINPHLKNAKAKQDKLDIQYNYVEEDQEEEQSYGDDHSSSQPRKTRPIGKTTKRQRRMLLAKEEAQATNRHITEDGQHPIVTKSKAAVRNLIKHRMRGHSHMHRLVPPKITFEYKEYSDEGSYEAPRRPLMESFNDVFTKKQSTKINLLQGLLENTEIAHCFIRDPKDVYYEVHFNDPEMNAPILIHDSYMKAMCKSQLRDFLMKKGK